MSEANITRVEAQARSTQLATDRYRIHVDLSGRLPSGEPLEAPEQTFVSTSTLTFTARTAGDTHVDLIADRVLEASLDGTALDPATFTGHRLPLSVEPGEHELSVTAVCRYSREGTGLHRFVDPADDRVYTYTQFEVPDARRVFACFEQPDLKGRFTFSVTAPESWTVVSNAARVEPTPAGDGVARWDFAETEPLSTYITAIVAGEYHLVEDEGYRSELSGHVPMSVLCRQSLAEHLDTERILKTTKDGFAVFEKSFAHRYPFGSYDQVFVPEYNFGAMENAGCITFRDEYVFRSRVTAAALRSRDNTILHELAHMWFGDLVTMIWWDDLWLNESFAEWASHFAQSESDEDPVTAWAEFCNKRKTWAYRQDQLPSTHPIAADMVDLDAVDQNFDGITYAKGASVLRQLVAYVGRDAFLAGVRDYFATHAFGNTQLSDLLSALEKSSGRDLSGWSAEWLEVAGVNTMRAEFDLDEQGRFTRFVVVQTAPEQYPTLRSHRMAIGVYALDGSTGSLSRRERVEVDITGERTEIAELVGVERGDLVLLNDDDLTYTKIRLDEQSLASVVEHIHHLDSPLSRALCWGAAWDMCRDGEMAAQDYVATVLRGVGTESDLTAVQALLGQATIAAELYTQPGTVRDEVRRTLEQGVARALVEAEAGSDHQLAIARALATAVTGETGAAVLQGWLDGEEVPAGLTVDTDLRWHLVANLARVGAADEATIDAEVERDNTIAGREAAGGARAAIPTRSAKAEAWRLLTEAEDMPNESYRRIAAQFFQTGQEELVGRYLEPYLDAARAISEGAGVWARRGVPLQKAFLTSAFPVVVADQALVTRVTEWLADDSLSDPVRRAVSERCDDAVRALRCQDTSARA
ncbi:MAG TPA: aminopeptidase N [Candidatus Avipropionibacterium avicola]|uniref:Aminopeptidase N n=1 Tax=Candidatus Avipropionibacterium avicola TaxID=2840701 RepID=A0A9D1KMR0_9ACTN|nr:aminopeptidase N [Candidatus Avipropionibacterium avicola]